MIYNKDAELILDIFDVDKDRKDNLVDEYFVGSRGEIIATICNSNVLKENEKYLLMLEFGIRLVFSEIEIREEARRKALNESSTNQPKEDETV